MFYEEEEREADRIRTKYLLMKRKIQRVIQKKKLVEEKEQDIEPQLIYGN